MYCVDICWSVRRRKTSQLAEAGKITAAGWMLARLTLSSVGLKQNTPGPVASLSPSPIANKGVATLPLPPSRATNLSYPHPASLCPSVSVFVLCSWSRASFDRVSSRVWFVFAPSVFWWRECGSVINITSLFFCRALQGLPRRVHAALSMTKLLLDSEVTDDRVGLINLL